MRVLGTKGYLTHELRGKAYVYRATVARHKAQRLALRSVVSRFFAGSAEDLVLRLIEDEVLSPAQLEEIRRTVGMSAHSKRKKGGRS
jgi:predicted transcriptional regulator